MNEIVEKFSHAQRGEKPALICIYKLFPKDVFAFSFCLSVSPECAALGGKKYTLCHRQKIRKWTRNWSLNQWGIFAKLQKCSRSLFYGEDDSRFWSQKHCYGKQAQLLSGKNSVRFFSREFHYGDVRCANDRLQCALNTWPSGTTLRFGQVKEISRQMAICLLKFYRNHSKL